jgi:heme/copper-type cytochrome/quinol oxidase subunit 2
VIPASVSAGTVVAVFLMAVIVLGYVVIWAIWHFFFREAGDDVTGERPAPVPHKPQDP